MKKKKVSVCCGEPVKVETWISKTKRQVFICAGCGKTCEVKIIDEAECLKRS